jgi:hypothetical protein
VLNSRAFSTFAGLSAMMHGRTLRLVCHRLSRDILEGEEAQLPYWWPGWFTMVIAFKDVAGLKPSALLSCGGLTVCTTFYHPWD